MKHLQAKKNDGSEIVALADIKIGDEKSVADEAYKWAIFRRQYLIGLDIEENGLQNPIIVKKDGSRLIYVASGCRIQYAVLRGYTHIDSLILEDDKEILAAMQIQRADDGDLAE
jgi:hypothetical protein